MITVVYVCGADSDSDVVIFYKDEKKIGHIRPTPSYGNIGNIIESIIGEKVEVLTVDHNGEIYPENLCDIKKWGIVE